LPSNDLSSSYLTHRLFLHYLRKTEHAKYTLKEQKNVNKFHFSRSVAPNSPELSPFDYNVCSVMQQQVYQTSFRNVELKKHLIELWSRTLSTLLSTNLESII